MIDVVYVLGSGSQYNNRELRLSLRCLEANGKNIGKIFIVGEKPDWIQNVNYIPAKDDSVKELNTFRKVLLACRNGVSTNFLYMNDDFYMTKPFDAKTYPYFSMGELKAINNPSRYQMVSNKTLNLLHKLGIEKVMDFRGHCPMLYNRKKFLDLEQFYKDVKNIGFEFRTIYGNLYAKEYLNGFDCKVFGRNGMFDNIQGCNSSSDENTTLLDEIEAIYNKPSKYEKSA